MLTILDIFNEIYNTGDLDHGISKDHDGLPTLEELLPDAREIRRSERAGLSRKRKEGHLEHATEEDYDRVTSPKLRRNDVNVL